MKSVSGNQLDFGPENGSGRGRRQAEGSGAGGGLSRRVRGMLSCLLLLTAVTANTSTQSTLPLDTGYQL